MGKSKLLFFSMRRGDFWYKNGFQDMDNFVQPLDFLIDGVHLSYLSANGTEFKEFVSPKNTTIWKPFFFDLFNGQCYTMQLNQAKKFSKIVISVNSTVKIFPHSPGKIRTIANPTSNPALEGNYKYDVQYQLYQMLDNHGKPCNGSLNYSLDKCTENEAFKVGLSFFGVSPCNFFKSFRNQLRVWAVLSHSLKTKDMFALMKSKPKKP